MKYFLALCALSVFLGLLGNAFSIYFQGWFGGNIGKKHMKELGLDEEKMDAHE